MLEIYILLALNLCRYAQIVNNKNVYVTNAKLITCTHLTIYLMPLICLIIQLLTGWAHVVQYPDDSCDVSYVNYYAQIVNVLLVFALLIILNILVIAASIHPIHRTYRLRRTQHHISAREQYHHSLVVQSFIFYTMWLSLWSPNIIVYQFNTGVNTAALLVLDPFIIGALDVRSYQARKNVWVASKRRRLQRVQLEQRCVAPTIIEMMMHTVPQDRTIPPN